MPHVDRLIHGTQVWPELTHAAGRARQRHIASAYVGRHAAELMPLDNGNVAVVDASTNALKAGQSSPDAIASWLQAGAYVYSYEGLHAKAYLLGSCAFVGSANASRHSQEQLLEAVLHTDRREIRDQVRRRAGSLARPRAFPGLTSGLPSRPPAGTPWLPRRAGLCPRRRAAPPLRSPERGATRLASAGAEGRAHRESRPVGRARVPARS